MELDGQGNAKCWRAEGIGMGGPGAPGSEGRAGLSLHFSLSVSLHVCLPV